MNLNRVIIVGRVCADPELRETNSGTKVASFSMATNRYWTDKNNGKQEEVEFHNCVAWSKLAEVVSQYCKKGSLLLIEGRLQTREWEDKKGGKRRTTEVVVEKLQLGPKPQGTTVDPLPNSSAATNAPPAETTAKVPEIPTEETVEDTEGDDIPF